MILGSGWCGLPGRGVDLSMFGTFGVAVIGSHLLQLGFGLGTNCR
jgi:hypothetical protein